MRITNNLQFDYLTCGCCFYGEHPNGEGHDLFISFNSLDMSAVAISFLNARVSAYCLYSDLNF